MAATYVHLSGRDIDNAVFKANGMENKEDMAKPRFTVKICNKCRDPNEATAKYCIKCGTPLDLNVLQELESQDKFKGEVDSLKGATTLLMSTLDKGNEG